MGRAALSDDDFKLVARAEPWSLALSRANLKFRDMMPVASESFDSTGAPIYLRLLKELIQLEFNFLVLLLQRALQESIKFFELQLESTVGTRSHSSSMIMMGLNSETRVLVPGSSTSISVSSSSTVSNRSGFSVGYFNAHWHPVWRFGRHCNSTHRLPQCS